MEQAPTSDQEPVAKKRLRWWRLALFILLGLLVFAVLSLIGVNLYLQSNKVKIFDDLRSLNGGTVSFQEADIRLFEDFPMATLSFNSLIISDSTLIDNRNPIAQFDHCELAVSLAEWKAKKLSVSRVEINGGAFYSHTDLNDVNNIGRLLGADNTQSGLKIQAREIEVQCQNVYYQFTKTTSGKDIRGKAISINGSLNPSESDIRGDIDLVTDVKQMSFRGKNGAYLKDSRMTASFLFSLDKERIEIPETQLRVNGDQVGFSASIDLNQDELSELVFEVPQTDMKRMMPLLADNLRNTLSKFDVSGPFYSKTNITGLFVSGEDPEVHADLRIDGHRFRIKDMVFEDCYLVAKVRNRLPETITGRPGVPSDLNIDIAELRTRYDSFVIDGTSGNIRSTAEEGIVMDLHAQVEGEAAGMNEVLGNDQFLFDQGRVVLDANIKGPLDDIISIVRQTDAELSIKDMRVRYAPTQTSFPFESLELNKQATRADFLLNGKMAESGNRYKLKGSIDGLVSLILKTSNIGAKTNLSVSADKLTYEEILGLLESESTVSQESDTSEITDGIAQLKETLAGLYENFDPRLDIDINHLAYKDSLVLDSFRTKMSFLGPKQFNLTDTHFEVGGGSVDFFGEMDFSTQDENRFDYDLKSRGLDLQHIIPQLDFFGLQLLEDIADLPQDMDLRIAHKGKFHDRYGLIENSSTGAITFESYGLAPYSGSVTFFPDFPVGSDQKSMRMFFEGPPEVVDPFLDNQNFFFSDGRFSAKAAYNGRPTSLRELIYGADIEFDVENSSVFYHPAEVRIPIEQLNLQMEQDTATVYLRSGNDELSQEIAIRGSVIHLSEIILGPGGRDISTKLILSSPNLKWYKLGELINAFDTDSLNIQKNPNPISTAATLRGLMTRFEPVLQLSVDTFRYTPTLTLHDAKAHMFMDSLDILHLEDMDVGFNEGRMQLNAFVDLSELGPLSFDLSMSTEKIDLEKLLFSLDYLEVPALRDADELSGLASLDLWLQADMSGDGKGLLTESINGKLDYLLEDLEIAGLSWIDSLAIKLKREERFDVLRFAPIESSMTFDSSYVRVPLTEVSTNAINLFAEGEISSTDQTDLWLSIPLDNLGKVDSSMIPAKRGYALAGGKIHLQIYTDEAGEEQTRFRLSKRKFYKTRGDLDRLRRLRRLWRAERKIARKSK